MYSAGMELPGGRKWISYEIFDLLLLFRYVYKVRLCLLEYLPCNARMHESCENERDVTAKGSPFEKARAGSERASERRQKLRS